MSIRTYLYFADRDQNVSRIQMNTATFLVPGVWLSLLPQVVSYFTGISDAVFIRAEQVLQENETGIEPITGTGIAINTGLAVVQDATDNYVTYIIPSAKETIWDYERNPYGIVAKQEVIDALALALDTAGAISPLDEPIIIGGLVIIKAG